MASGALARRVRRVSRKLRNYVFFILILAVSSSFSLLHFFFRKMSTQRHVHIDISSLDEDSYDGDQNKHVISFDAISLPDCALSNQTLIRKRISALERSIQPTVKGEGAGARAHSKMIDMMRSNEFASNPEHLLQNEVENLRAILRSCQIYFGSKGWVG
ncbi:hypothetical protein GUITHDRAFT_131838 [Guillardia theta CCMP2712]|uniref:Uncharacterized protein n=1 Tax=Guillardia theta (strain CCMP2712) TaxID=905079 RepID=L1K2M6_GUITC|nr:hypothetical protein GUITHDRAFT_131838 [Guillardia theta CCMP2712]EKX54844.1 hypothetical protein GUITHDRAFT_131838 [Guillardia theta CCMP2712]|mmetsp:Transcript_25943/g.85403  ORF Transcript_25943/g.85403 Transcript_25943/m.85403 type:complete len:159 (-) Transcript_25943:1540-2016(-)|eukprot:XP_005841824.1 hypothetical protein GUITHDRAFT_131838 [Guillardia theta CCMP2712]